MLYLDNSATTQPLPEVKKAMLPFLLEEFGNPSSKYYSLANNSKNAVQLSRKSVSTLLDCDTDEIIFTSGATESNNMIIKGVSDFYKDRGKHIVTSRVEHPSILETFKYLESQGYTVTYMDVDKFGRIKLDNLKVILQESSPILVSIMWGNNETGSINDIEVISELCLKHKTFFHTDATQVVGKIPINLSELPGINFLSCSGHKFHGPKGVGVAVIKKDKIGLPTKLTPLLHGGGQESDYRSGTLAVHNIIGIGKAAELAYDRLDLNHEKLQKLEKKLISILQGKFGDNIIFNHDTANKIPGIVSVQFVGLNNEILLKKLSPYIAASTGSACSSTKPSHVLQAIGLSMDELRNTIRFSLSPYTDEKDLSLFEEL